jgi:hypothetical protein
MSYLQYRRLFHLEIPTSVFFSFHHDYDNHLCTNRHKKSPILGSQFFPARSGPFIRFFHRTKETIHMQCLNWYLIFLFPDFEAPW